MGGYKVAKDIVTNLVDSMNITVPVAIHLDHGDYDAAMECIEVTLLLCLMALTYHLKKT